MGDIYSYWYAEYPWLWTLCIRAKTRKGGGTSLYVKSSIPFKKRPDLEFKKSIFESSVIEIDKHVFHSRHNIIIVIFYRSPNSALNTFNDSLEKLLNVIQKERNMPIFWAISMLIPLVNLLVRHHNVNNLLTYFLLIIIGNSYIYTYTSFRKLT